MFVVCGYIYFAFMLWVDTQGAGRYGGCHDGLGFLYLVCFVVLIRVFLAT